MDNIYPPVDGSGVQPEENPFGPIACDVTERRGRVTTGVKPEIAAELESHHPAGGVEGRIGLSMTEATGRHRQIAPGGTVRCGGSGDIEV